MKKVLKIFTVLVLSFFVFTFTACRNERYIGIEGTIVAKEYVPEHKTISFIPTGKSLIPITNHHPDAWYITVEYDINGKKEKAEFEITEEEYKTYDIGDIYIYNGGDNQ